MTLAGYFNSLRELGGMRRLVEDEVRNRTQSAENDEARPKNAPGAHLWFKNRDIGLEPVELTSREFALLELFLQNPGRVLTRTLIVEKIWDASYDMETNLIDVYVRRLRKKFEPSADRPLIKTVRGTGYQLA